MAPNPAGAGELSGPAGGTDPAAVVGAAVRAQGQYDTGKLPCTRTVGGAKVRLISEKAVEKLREQREKHSSPGRPGRSR